MILKFVALGGLGEIGKNMMAFEFEGKILVVDAGVKFPDDRTPGIDFIIPDMSYLLANRNKVMAVILTHGHEDHVGSLPYLLQQIPVPVWGTDLTLGLAEKKLKELNVACEKHLIKPGEMITIKPFQVEFLPVTHSVPAGVSLAIHNKLGTIIHSGDFKFDQTPVDRNIINFHRLAELASRGVLCLLCDSTNAERIGYAPSEKSVKPVLEEIFRSCKHRIIITTFASNVHRLQQILSTAHDFKRKVVVDGMSLSGVVEVAQDLGYLSIPANLLIKTEEIPHYHRSELAIITTGSQGEPLSALARIAAGEHKKIKVEPGDMVIFSADPIPGNEILVAETIDNLFRQKADVIYGSGTGVHVSGHGYAGDIKMMINMVKPRYFIPIHGEYRHLVHCGRLAAEMGIGSENVFLLENGEVVNFTPGRAYPGGKIAAAARYVDGIFLDDLRSRVLRDRQILASEGAVFVSGAVSLKHRYIVAGPDFIFRGFLQEREIEEFQSELQAQSALLLKQLLVENNDVEFCEQRFKDFLQRYLMKNLRRRPMILINILATDELGKRG